MTLTHPVWRTFDIGSCPLDKAGGAGPQVTERGHTESVELAIRGDHSQWQYIQGVRVKRLEGAHWIPGYADIGQERGGESD